LFENSNHQVNNGGFFITKEKTNEKTNRIYNRGGDDGDCWRRPRREGMRVHGSV
jgi:hypothetical protein